MLKINMLILFGHSPNGNMRTPNPLHLLVKSINAISKRQVQWNDPDKSKEKSAKLASGYLAEILEMFLKAEPGCYTPEESNTREGNVNANLANAVANVPQPRLCFLFDACHSVFSTNNEAYSSCREIMRQDMFCQTVEIYENRLQKSTQNSSPQTVATTTVAAKQRPTDPQTTVVPQTTAAQTATMPVATAATDGDAKDSSEQQSSRTLSGLQPDHKSEMENDLLDIAYRFTGEEVNRKMVEEHVYRPASHLLRAAHDFGFVAATSFGRLSQDICQIMFNYYLDGKRSLQPRYMNTFLPSFKRGYGLGVASSSQAAAGLMGAQDNMSVSSGNSETTTQDNLLMGDGDKDRTSLNIVQ